jgi:pyruvate dehydrogenase E2 component (dihydrolipoamide acetyltransferase)
VDYQGGSITISNLGMYGVREFAAIINPPQSAVLAVGAAERRPLEGAAGSVRFGSVMSLTLSCDHRVIDGALGARLLETIKTLLQSPLQLVT